MTQPTLHWKLVIDAADPHGQATFWAEALGYLVEDNSTLIERLLGFGAVPEAATVEFRGHRAWRDLMAVRHPEDTYDGDSGTGLGRRILFQRVPERKTVKNRLHLDLHAGPDRRFGGVLLGNGSKPGDVLTDTEALTRAKTFFAQEPPVARFPYEEA